MVTELSFYKVPFITRLGHLVQTVTHYMTKHINLERQGRLLDEWYEFASFSNLIAITKKLRPIGMGYSGRKLVSRGLPSSCC